MLTNIHKRNDGIRKLPSGNYHKGVSWAEVITRCRAGGWNLRGKGYEL